MRADALSGLEIKAAVTRTSWSLAEKTRTLWAEIDLPTKNFDIPAKNADPPAKKTDPPAASGNGLRPGMYVNTTVIIQRAGVPMLPQDALVVSGNETYCYLLRDGKAVKTSVVRGLRDGAWIEVTKMEDRRPVGESQRRRGRDHGRPGRVDRRRDGENRGKTRRREPAVIGSYPRLV